MSSLCLKSLWILLVLLASTQAGSLTKSAGKRIVNGQIITIDKAPYVVQLKDGMNRQYCGGTLVITAAHCFDDVNPEDLTVVGGASTRYDVGVQRKAASVIKHPGYDSSTYDLDIAVIKLDKAMLGENIATMPLCKANLEAGNYIQVSGWGKISEFSFPSDELRTVRLPMISKTDCSKLLKEIDPYDLTQSMVCAYIPNMDSCTGDSGGPAIYGNELCGVVSWGHGCARENSPGVYTSIDAVRSFINEAMKK